MSKIQAIIHNKERYMILHAEIVCTFFKNLDVHKLDFFGVYVPWNDSHFLGNPNLGKMHCKIQHHRPILTP